MAPEVSAVITTHGRPACLQQALASLCAETHRNIEIVIVDDDAGFGVAHARNHGLSAARGEFVIFLDDDDVALPHRISSLVSAARRHDASLCFGMTRRRVDGTDELLESVPTYVPAGPIEFCDLLSCNPHVNAVLARTDALRAVGGFDVGADHFDDWSAWLRIADRDAVMWSIATEVAEWRLHPRGLSANVLQKRAMKTRLLSLFERLQLCLSDKNARAVAMAHRVVTDTDIVTYDDYAEAMADYGATRITRTLSSGTFSLRFPSSVHASHPPLAMK